MYHAALVKYMEKHEKPLPYVEAVDVAHHTKLGPLQQIEQVGSAYFIKPLCSDVALLVVYSRMTFVDSLSTAHGRTFTCL